jgi:hypothetical protein
VVYSGTSVQFVVTAMQTITNDDYHAMADGNLSAVGEAPIITVILASPDYTSTTRAISYTYDAANRLTSANAMTYTWDNNPLRYVAGASRQLNKRWGAQLHLRARSLPAAQRRGRRQGEMHP